MAAEEASTAAAVPEEAAAATGAYPLPPFPSPVPD